MDKSMKTEQSQEGVPTIAQMLLKYLLTPYHLVKSVGLYLFLVLATALSVVTLVAWSYVVLPIFLLITIMGVLKKTYLVAIYIPKSKKLSDLPAVLKLKLQYMLSFTEQEIKGLATLLKVELKKEKNSEENF